METKQCESCFEQKPAPEVVGLPGDANSAEWCAECRADTCGYCGESISDCPRTMAHPACEGEAMIVSNKQFVRGPKHRPLRKRKTELGTEYLYRITFHDVSDPKGQDIPFQVTRIWGVNAEHALDRFYEDPDDGWEHHDEPLRLREGE